MEEKSAKGISTRAPHWFLPSSHGGDNSLPPGPSHALGNGTWALLDKHKSQEGTKRPWAATCSQHPYWGLRLPGAAGLPRVTLAPAWQMSPALLLLTLLPARTPEFCLPGMMTSGNPNFLVVANPLLNIMGFSLLICSMSPRRSCREMISPAKTKVFSYSEPHFHPGLQPKKRQPHFFREWAKAKVSNFLEKNFDAESVCFSEETF